MRAFEVPALTPVLVIRDGKEWRAPNIVNYVTRKSQTFFIEEMIVDPLGHVGCGPNDVTIGGAYAAAGYYGFRRNGFALLVGLDLVTVL